MVGRFSFILLLTCFDLLAQDWQEEAFDIQGAPAAVDHEIQALNLNTATVHQLETLPMMTRAMADSIVRYRSEMGLFISVTELQGLGIFSRDQYTIVKAHLFVREKTQNKQAGYSLLRYTQVLQRRQGYTNQTYLGGPQHMVLRTKYAAKRIDLGLTYEKDAGEIMSWQSLKRRYNHLVGYVRLKPRGLVDELGFGTFQTTWGQGLLVGNGFAMGKGRETIHSITRNANLRPYISLNETSYFTGSYARLRWSHFSMELIGSYDLLYLTGAGSSRYQSGLFRTKTDTARASTSRWVTGSQIRFQKENFQLQLAGIYAQYTRPLTNSTRDGSGFSASFQWQRQNFLFFGESATVDGGHATQVGFLGAVSHDADIAFAYRSFSEDFNSPFGENAFRSNSHSREQGTYIGIRLNIAEHWQLNMYADVFSSGKYDPTGKHSDLMVQLKLEKPDYTLRFYSRHRTKQISSSGKLQTYVHGVKRTGNITFDVNINDQLTLRSGGWLSVFDEDTGIMIHQDLRMKWKSLSLQTRIAFVHSPSFSNRFYIFEPDVTQTFNIPMYYGISIRSMAVIAVRLAHYLKLEAKYTSTAFRDRESVGSGQDKIEGNKMGTIRVQAIARF